MLGKGLDDKTLLTKKKKSVIMIAALKWLRGPFCKLEDGPAL